MAAVEILKDMFFIQRGFLNANHFVFRLDKPVLIDTGYLPDFGTTEKLISDAGVDLRETGLIISTHCHCDHIGGNKRIQEISGCEILTHPAHKHYMDTGDSLNPWWSYYNQKADFYKCTGTLSDGDVITIGPHDFEVMETPGHSRDGLVLYNADNRILLSSDTLWESDVGPTTMAIEGEEMFQSMLESLEKIEPLEVKTVFPGHGRPFNDFAGAIRKSRKVIKDCLENREKIGMSQIKKLMIYTLLMEGETDEEQFGSDIINALWFKEAVDRFLEEDYESVYRRFMDGFISRDIVIRKDGNIFTTVDP